MRNDAYPSDRYRGRRESGYEGGGYRGPRPSQLSREPLFTEPAEVEMKEIKTLHEVLLPAGAALPEQTKENTILVGGAGTNRYGRRYGKPMISYELSLVQMKDKADIFFIQGTGAAVNRCFDLLEIAEGRYGLNRLAIKSGTKEIESRRKSEGAYKATFVVIAVKK